MRWVHRVRSFLYSTRPDKEPEVEIISLEGLESWVTVNIAESIVQFDLASQFREYCQKIHDKRRFLRTHILEWETRIDDAPRANRKEIYRIFTRTKELLEFLDFPESLTVASYFKYNVKFEEDLNDVLQMIEKSSFSHSYGFLFGLQQEQQPVVNPLLQELLVLHSLRDGMAEKLLKSGLKRLHILKKRVQVLLLLDKELSQLKKAEALKQDRLSEARDKVNTKKQELSDQQQRPDSQGTNNVAQEKRDAEFKLDSCRAEIVRIFNQLSPVLEMYAESHGGELIQNYIKNPLDSFVEDEGLSILHTLAHCKALLVSDKLIIKGLSQSYSLLEQVLDGRLQKLQNNYFFLMKEKEKVQTEFFKSHQSRKESEAEYKLAHYSKALEQLEEEVTILSENLETKHDQLIREKDLFENLVRVGLKKDIHITL